MALVLLALLAGVVAAVLTAAALGPDTMTLERGIDIKAPPERIFPLINDLRRWPEWPTDTEEGKTTRTFGPISSGKGATSQWTGSGSTGSGRMEITESTPPSRVTVVVDFRKPFAAHNINDFTLERRGDSTHVTWSWRGQNVFVLRVMSLFTNMDTMMGSHFESGLRALKKKAESSS
jgi:uncharacterized protein YndB with AHSA1/START domain